MALVASLPTLPALHQALSVQDFEKSSKLYNTLVDDADQTPVADQHIPADEVMVGTNFDQPAIRWAKSASIGSLNGADIHGRIFVPTEDNALVAHEYQDGPLPDLSLIGHGFLGEFVEHMLILDQATVMVNQAAANLENVTPGRVTGWRFELVDGNPRVCAANETHSEMTTSNHKVFKVGKPHPRFENVEELKAALTGVGVL
ncbi:hypothetical protein QBC44DRAFT_346039 [Cladorrhinum sp. PSN332]|nr:hypothetical protein QBC44DRAFT_346039 [Cladorrhinum sp. PSN332]